MSQHGRPRAAILGAAWDLFEERGLAALTIEGVAARAGVGKTTIYRWWPNKAAILLDAMTERMAGVIAFPDTGSTREDLRRQMVALLGLFGTTAGRAYLSLVAAGVDDPSVAAALRDRLIAARRAASIACLRRGVERGELRPDLDLGLVVDALYGAVYYNVLVAHAPPDAAYVERLLAQHLDPLALRSGK